MTKTSSSTDIDPWKHVTQNGTTTEQHIAFIKTINIKRIPIYEFTLQRVTYLYVYSCKKCFNANLKQVHIKQTDTDLFILLLNY